jgi:transposase
MIKGKSVGTRPGDAERPQESGVAAPGRGGRMSRQRKTATVLRLLRGEDLESDRLKARLGAALIERDLLNEKIAILEANRPLAPRRRKP